MRQKGVREGKGKGSGKEGKERGVGKEGKEMKYEEIREKLWVSVAGIEYWPHMSFQAAELQREKDEEKVKRADKG